MKRSSTTRQLRPCFPDARQRLLLDVCLAEPANAVRAFERWIPKVDLETLEPASMRLLPLASHRLQAMRVNHPEMPRLRGVLRHAWANNLTLRRRLEKLVERLDGMEVPHVLLKGLPLAFDVYPNPGARVMDDVDILVPLEHARDVMEALQRDGWIPLHAIPRAHNSAPPDEALCFQHGCAFRSPEGLNIDLHWFALEECSFRGADESFWKRRCRLSGPRELWQLSPEDQLLHVVVHGLRANPISSIRWIADAVLLLGRHSTAFDWRIVLSEARRRRLLVPVRHALSYLADYAPEQITPEVLDPFWAEPVTLLERAAHHGNVGTSIAAQFAATWLRYRRMTPSRGPIGRVWGFPRFLRLAWSTDTYSHVVAHIVRRVLQRNPG